MEKYKILYVANEGNLKGGGQISLLNLVTRLNKEKFKPFFVCPTYGSFVSALRDTGFEVDIVYFPRIKSLNLFAIITAIRQIRRIIKEKGIDIVHSNGPRISLLSAIAAQLTKAKIIWHERTMLEKGMWDIEKFFYFFADRIICNSEAIRRRFLRKGKIHDKVLTIINGVDINIFRPGINGTKIRKEFGINEREIIIGMLSRIDPTKGQRYFIETAAELKKQFSNLRFFIVGSPCFQSHLVFFKQLQEMVAKLQLQNNIVFAGFRNDMPEVFQAMDIVVLASDLEGCGRVLLEAMASAKPLVATNTGGTPEIVVDNETGILIPPKNTKALTAALTKLLNDKNLTWEMGRKGRERVEKYFTIEEHVRKTEAVYEEVLDASPRNKRSQR